VRPVVHDLTMFSGYGLAHAVKRHDCASRQRGSIAAGAGADGATGTVDFAGARNETQSRHSRVDAVHRARLPGIRPGSRPCSADEFPEDGGQPVGGVARDNTGLPGCTATPPPGLAADAPATCAAAPVLDVPLSRMTAKPDAHP